MPRTERGAASCNRRERSPVDGQSPITKHDRRDARFKNATSKPPRTEDRPPFDRCMYVPAVCEGASCGGDASTKITGAQTGYEHLIGRARRPLNLVAATVPGAPPNLSRFFVVAITNHKSKFFRPHKVEHDDGTTTIEHVLFVRRNGRKLQHIGRGWFADDYPWRWDQPASCYVDVRIDGKASNSADLTWPQAAGRIADETLDNLSTGPNKHGGRRCPLIFYEKPFLCIFLFWLMAGLDAPLSDFWFFVAEPPNTEKKPRRHIPSQIYC
jgi:hypothetical protein